LPFEHHLSTFDILIRQVMTIDNIIFFPSDRMENKPQILYYLVKGRARSDIQIRPIQIRKMGSGE